MTNDSHSAGPRKVVVHVQRGRNADRSMRDVLAELLWTGRYNAAAIRVGGPPEFLHQFRVSLRGARVMLPRAKELYRSPLVGQLSEELRWLTRVTSKARDLDTLTLSRSTYLVGVPASVPTHFDALFDLSRRHAAQEVAATVDVVGESRFEEAMTAWESLVRTPGAVRSKAQRPAKKVAARWIRRRYEAAARGASRATKSSSGRAVHDLRKRIKALRYQIAFYRALFPAKPTRRILQVVSRGQQILGGIHDARVHAGITGALSQELFESRLGGSEAVMAAGELRALIHQEENRQRRLIKRWRREFLALKPTIQRVF